MSARVRKVLVATVAAAIPVVGGLTNPASASNAAIGDADSTVAAALDDCKWAVNKAPYKENGKVKKKVIVRDCPSLWFKYRLQTHRWWGWEDLKVTPMVASPYEDVMKKSCVDLGLRSYRVHSEAYLGNELLNDHNSKEARFWC